MAKSKRGRRTGPREDERIVSLRERVQTILHNSPDAGNIFDLMTIGYRVWKQGIGIPVEDIKLVLVEECMKFEFEKEVQNTA
jgi:hypothetical protein